MSMNPTPETTGNKADGLYFLEQQGFAVPYFFVLTYNEILEIEADSEALPRILERKDTAKARLWAVRSSAEVEDGKEKSYAGLFTTLLNVETANLPPAILQVVAGYRKVAGSDYASTAEIQYGIIVQKMLAPHYSGVLFSKAPTGSGQAVANIVPGLGEELVSGRAEPYTVTAIGKRYQFPEENQTYTGKTAGGEIIKTGQQIKQETALFWKKLFKAGATLEKLKGFPVDVEFATENSQLYFLQVRPITTFSTQRKVLSVWDNSNITENFPGLTMPLSVSFVQHSYDKAYRRLAGFLGMSKRLIEKNDRYFSEMTGAVYGAMYYNLTSWQKLFYQLPFGRKTSHIFPKILGMQPARFEKPKQRASVVGYLAMLGNIFLSVFRFGRHKTAYLSNFNRVMSEYENLPLHTKSLPELRAIFYDIEIRLGNNWIAPVLNGLLAMLSLSVLKKIVGDSSLLKDYPNFTNDILFSADDVISVTIVKDLSRIFEQISKNKELLTAFRTQTVQRIKQELKEHKKHNTLINNYIKKYGERSEVGELKIETVNYKENPDLFILFLKNNVSENVVSLSGREKFDYEKIIKQIYRYKPVRRFLLLKLIRYTVARVKDRENLRFLRTKTFHLVRRICRATDKQLLQQKLISNKNDSLYLKLEELFDLELKNEYPAIIQKRKQKYAKYKQVKHVSRYHLTKEGFEEAPVVTASNEKHGVIQGTGCSSGTVEAEVFVVDDYDKDVSILSGKILIASFFEPGKINYFSQATGLISERGSLLSHTAILSREMGIPAIVGAKGILQQVKTGDRVRMNGATGTVQILYSAPNARGIAAG